MLNLNNSEFYKNKYHTNNPIKWINIPEVLDSDYVMGMKDELHYEYVNNSNSHKIFTRAGSNMFEILDNHKLERANKLINFCHSKDFLDWLENFTEIDGLICDPHLTGAGYMRCGNGDSLKIHTDFNWNEKLKLHRRLNVIFYLNSEWDEEWNGDLQLWDKTNSKKLHSIYPSNGNMLIWEYDSLGFHGHPNPLACPKGYYRDGFRFFFYTSNSTHNQSDTPHRSLYYYDSLNKKPIDFKDAN